MFNRKSDVSKQSQDSFKDFLEFYSIEPNLGDLCHATRPGHAWLSILLRFYTSPQILNFLSYNFFTVSVLILCQDSDNFRQFNADSGRFCVILVIKFLIRKVCSDNICAFCISAFHPSVLYLLYLQLCATLDPWNRQCL